MIFSDNEELTAEEFTCSNESAVTVDIDDEPQSKYYLKWSTAYKEACLLYTSFVGLFGSFAWMLFVCGLVVAVFDTAVAYESGQALSLIHI